MELFFGESRLNGNIHVWDMILNNSISITFFHIQGSFLFIQFSDEINS